jgi:hypothetical protein
MIGVEKLHNTRCTHVLTALDLLLAVLGHDPVVEIGYDRIEVGQHIFLRFCL